MRGLPVFVILASSCGGVAFRSATAPDDAGADATTTAPAPEDGGDAAVDGPEPPPVRESCAAILSERPKARDGVYTIAPLGVDAGLRVKVYCDMTTDDGGWTLVGRSVVDGDGSFGWKVDEGSVDDDTRPYALSMARVPIPFTEILFGSYESGKTWGADASVYKHLVPAGFVQTYGDAGYEPDGGAITVLGGCKPAGGPWMVSVIGFTNETDHYFFRDNMDEPRFGLYPGGFDTNAGGQPGDCEHNALLGSRQGMIFVR
jgi:hypothetical protein